MPSPQTLNSTHLIGVLPSEVQIEGRSLPITGLLKAGNAHYLRGGYHNAHPRIISAGLLPPYFGNHGAVPSRKMRFRKRLRKRLDVAKTPRLLNSGNVEER